MLRARDRVQFSAGIVSSECDTLPELSSVPEVMLQSLVYVYTDTFGECTGRDGMLNLDSFNFCYSPRGHAATETLFTVEIRKMNEMVETSFGVSVNPDYDSSNCSNALDHSNCCIELMLVEPLSVGPNRHYALRVPSGPNSLPLRHRNETTNGFQSHINTGV